MACSDPNMDVDRPHSDERELAGLLALSDVEFDGLFDPPPPFPPTKTQPTPILNPSQIVPIKQPTFTLDLNPSPSPPQSTPLPMSKSLWTALGLMFTFGADPWFRFFLLTTKLELKARFNGICIEIVAVFVEQLTVGLEVGGLKVWFGRKFAKLGKLLCSSSVNVEPLFPVEFVSGWLFIGEILALSS